MQQQTLDMSKVDFSKVGKPEKFDVVKYLEAVSMMIEADEVQFALKMMDNLPAYYRDHVPEEVVKLRKDLYKQLFTYQTYAQEHVVINKESAIGMYNSYEAYPRAQITRDVIKKFNDKSQVPHLVEMGPANYWLPMALSEIGLTFKYYSIDINEIAQSVAAESLSSHWDSNIKNPVIFNCCEVMEHLWDEQEARHYYDRLGLTAEVAIFSVPKYSYGGGLPPWPQRDLGHLRTYTPREFQNVIMRLFPEFSLQVYDGFQISILAVRS